MKQKIGIIGCGAVTEQFYLKTFPNLPNCRIEYLFDKDQERSRFLSSISGAKSSGFEELKEKSDIVIICTPPASHYSLVKESLKDGKVVVCEKPFVSTYKEALDLVESCTSVNSKLYVAHFRRLYPSVLLAKKLIKTLDLGNLNTICVNEGGRFNWGAKSDYFLTNPLGGVIFDTGSHTMDMGLFISGLDEKQVDVHINKIMKDKIEPSHEVTANFDIKWEGGKVGVDFKLSRYEVISNQVSFVFDNGELIIPSFLSNFVLVKTFKGRSVIYSSYKYNNNQEVFYNQYRNIFSENNDEYFSAKRFLSLTKILEVLNNS